MQQANGTLEIQIGGTLSGFNFDAVSVAGNAVVGGILDVSLINGFTPALGQQFTVLTAGNVTNSGLVLGGSAASEFFMLVGPSSIVLQAVPEPGTMLLLICGLLPLLGRRNSRRT